MSGSIGVAIVDDDEDFAAALAELLGLDPLMHVVGTATTVEEGIGLLSCRDVVLALVDVHMPDGGGLRLVEIVARWEVSPALMLISANPATAATRASGVEFVRKQDLQPSALLHLVQGSSGGE